MKRKTKAWLIINSTLATTGLVFGFSIFSNAANPSTTTNSPILNKTQQARATVNLDGFKAGLKNYSGYDFLNNPDQAQNLILDSFVQFSNGPFVAQPLLTLNMTKNEFVNQFLVALQITNDEAKLGSEVTINLSYRNPQVISNLTAKITNLKPQVNFNLNLENGAYDIKQNKQFAFNTAYEFAANFQQNLTANLIQFNNQQIDSFLISTNISEADFSKFRPIFKVGTIDNINGQITNNSISLLVPELNADNNAAWEIDKDVFVTKTFNFDLINFEPHAIAIDYAPNGIFDISKNAKLNQLTADNFNEEIFLQNLIQYNSTFLNQNFLVAINYDIETFTKSLADLQIRNVDITTGQLDLSFSLNVNGLISQHQYTLQGFKKVVLINNKQSTINKKNYPLLDGKELVEAFEKDDTVLITNFINANLNLFFANDEKAIFQTSIDNFADLFLSKLNKKFTINIFKTLGQIKITFNLDLNASADQVLYFNEQPLSNNQLDLIISGFETQKVILEVQKSQIDDPNAFSALDNFIDNFVDFIDVVPPANGAQPFANPATKIRAASRFSAIRTNLTPAEFAHVSNVSIDRSDQYAIALVTFSSTLNGQTQENKIGINSIKKAIQYQVSQDPLDAQKYPEWQNKSVDDFSNEDVFNLIGFNGRQNDYQLMSINASRALFESVLLKNIQINRFGSYVDVELSLLTSANKTTQERFRVINLHWRLEPASWISILVVSGIAGFIFIGLLLHFWRRAHLKRKVLKINNWNHFDEGSK